MLSGFPDEDAYYTMIRLELAPSDVGTTLRLRQENTRTPESHGHWNFYWAMALDRIRRLAETGAI
jgi:hypothetical protein